MSSSSKKSSKPFSRNAGDWTCPEKSNHCNRCEAEKPKDDSKKCSEIGHAAAKNSRGLFSADDWSCLKCGNINWARRSSCNICNAKKLADDQRTGYGGGFMEREVVEYKDRESSDSEYDEFGRRKKNKSKSVSSSRRRSRSRSSSRRSSRRRSRSRSRSRSSDSSSSSSSSDRSRRKKSSKKSPPKRSRRSSSSSSDSSSKEKPTSNKSSASPVKVAPQKEPHNSSDEEEDSGSDEDLSKYNLFDDDDDLEAFKKGK